MLSTGLLLFGLLTEQAQPASAEPIKQMLKEVADSGRSVTLAESPDDRVTRVKTLPAGPPPLLSFRYFESKAHHLAGTSQLMLDDAGH